MRRQRTYALSDGGLMGYLVDRVLNLQLHRSYPRSDLRTDLLPAFCGSANLLQHVRDLDNREVESGKV